MNTEAHGELCQSDLSTGCTAVPGQLSELCEVGPHVCSVAVAPVRLDRKSHGATRSLGRYLCQCQTWIFSSSRACSESHHRHVPESLPGKHTPKAPWVPAVDRDLQRSPCSARVWGGRLSHCLLSNVPPGTTGPTGSWCGKLQGPMCGRATAQSETNKPGPPRDVRAWPLVERPSHPRVWTVWLPQGQE